MTDAPFCTFYSSPLGELLLTSDGDALTGLYLPRRGVRPAPAPGGRPDCAVFREARGQLGAYFGGKLRTFSLPLAPGGTEFQQLVWRELCNIPFGATASYAEVARRIGRPTASRAVGAANGSNPISIVVPCHRVVGADGTLTGYGGGLDRKEWLLRHETKVLAGGAD
jgi:methylated-DNA-[protein]-cysteine S-methyltransferase